MSTGVRLLLYSIVILLFACDRPASDRESIPQNEVGPIDEVNNLFETDEEYSPRKLDSITIERFLSVNEDDVIEREGIRNFYERRDHQYAWFVDDSLSESANSFLALVNSGDTIHKAVASLRDDVSELIERPHAGITDSMITGLELALTAKFFEYATKRYGGILRRELKDLNWYIPRRKKNYDRLLDSLAAGRMDLSAIEPLHPQYFQLKEHLKKYHSLAALPWDPIKLTRVRKIEPGKNAPEIPLVREKLKLLGDLISNEDTLADPAKYDSAMVAAVERFQARHGLLQDGVIGANVLEMLNVPPAQRLRTLLVNMERLRWMPEQDDSDVLLVNIPEFKLHVFEEGRIHMSMDVVVGTSANRTVIFSDTVTYIVFSPTWTIPKSIIKDEILPAIEKDKDHLEENNMEIIGGTEDEPIIQQQPGSGNSLGRVKFMFPNSYSIYLHDTPAKSLFNRDKRAFSHGCIRISKPTELAEYLLRNDTSWTGEKIEEAMNSDEEIVASLKEKRPVMITYFTAWMDEEGRLNFRDDVYGHDERLINELFMDDGPPNSDKVMASEGRELTSDRTN